MAKKDLLNSKLEKLTELVKYFEQSEIDLNTGIKYYEEGVKLASEIKTELSSLELRIKEIKLKYQDNVPS